MTGRYKLGRKPRAHDPRVLHYSALLAGRTLPPLPPSVNYAAKMPADLGMMLNDQLGCCTCAALGHGLQVHTFNAQGRMLTDPDALILNLYEAACGYVPGDPATDQGGNEQDVLTYAMRQGIPTPDGGDRVIGFVEVDPRNLDDVRRINWECGFAYIGLDVPGNLLAGGDPPAVWDDASGEIEGGHAIILTGYGEGGFDLVSWGRKFRMTERFFRATVDEVYGVADRHWIEATGKTPAGMSLPDLEAAMRRSGLARFGAGEIATA